MLFAYHNYLDIHRCRRGSAADQIGSFLGDHDNRRVDVAADQVRHHRSVDDAQCVDTQHPELGVDDRIRIVRPSHLAGAERVMKGNHSRPDMSVELI